MSRREKAPSRTAAGSVSKALSELGGGGPNMFQLHYNFDSFMTSQGPNYFFYPLFSRLKMIKLQVGGIVLSSLQNHAKIARIKLS